MTAAMTKRAPIAVLLVAIALPACQPMAGEGAGQSAIAKDPTAPFSAIAPDETIRFLGTEPFWNGEITGSRLRYATPEDQAGQTITVRRFAGNNGLGFTGTLRGASLDLAITPGACSDGMSDRRFPFTVTLKLGDDQRSGCAWTDRMPYRETARS